MNRQRDAEGENASHGQSDGGEAEGEARGGLATKRRRRDGQGRRHVAKMRLIPPAWLQLQSPEEFFNSLTVTV